MSDFAEPPTPENAGRETAAQGGRPPAGHAEEMEIQLAKAMAALRMLFDAADVYAADQSTATDERCGLVQPITADDGRALNEALVVAAKILENAGTQRPGQ